MEKNFRKQIFSLHLEFHRFMDELNREFNPDLLSKEKYREITGLISSLHSLFDTAVQWLEKLSDENLRLQGALEEARKHAWIRREPETWRKGVNREEADRL